MSFSLSEYTKVDVGWCFAQTPLGSLQTYSGMKGRGGED